MSQTVVRFWVELISMALGTSVEHIKSRHEDIKDFLHTGMQ